jgi:hypothetical protein
VASGISSGGALEPGPTGDLPARRCRDGGPDWMPIPGPGSMPFDIQKCHSALSRVEVP